MSRITTFRFTLRPTRLQEHLFRVAGGAARLSFNVCLAAVVRALDDRELDPGARVPWSAFDLINTINAWKRDRLAAGETWLSRIPALVLEEAAVDLARGLSAYQASKRGERPGPKMGFPTFKRKSATTYAFRVRSKNGSIAIGAIGEPRSVKIPKFGVIVVREDTRALRRMLRAGSDRAGARAVITAVTVRQYRGRWIAAVTVRAADLHPAARHQQHSTEDDDARWVGVDVGLTSLVVAATAGGEPVATVPAQRALRRRLAGLRRRSRAVSRKKPGSGRRRAAQMRLATFQATTAAIRKHHLHQVSNLLVKNHDRLVIEDLNIKGMLANHHLARSVADASLATLGRMLEYKAARYGATLLVADRWYPSSKTCSACGADKKKLALSERPSAATPVARGSIGI